MLRLSTLLVPLAAGLLRSRRDLIAENLAMRQQLAALRQSQSRPHLAASDRIFWVLLRGLWPRWKQALVIVQPETVIRWHLTGFRQY